MALRGQSVASGARSTRDCRPQWFTLPMQVYRMQLRREFDVSDMKNNSFG